MKAKGGCCWAGGCGGLRLGGEEELELGWTGWGLELGCCWDGVEAVEVGA